MHISCFPAIAYDAAFSDEPVTIKQYVQGVYCAAPAIGIVDLMYALRQNHSTSVPLPATPSRASTSIPSLRAPSQSLSRPSLQSQEPTFRPPLAPPRSSRPSPVLPPLQAALHPARAASSLVPAMPLDPLPARQHRAQALLFPALRPHPQAAQSPSPRSLVPLLHS